MSHQELEDIINKYKMLGDRQVKVETKNLMFEVESHTSSTGVDYLRPEIAQGIFVNFKVCDSFMRKELPFGIAQIGKSFRNEISPKPYLRLREFIQAEIEYFVDPFKKDSIREYEKFCNVVLPLLSAKDQLGGINISTEITIKEAIETGIIANKTIAYFLFKISCFSMNLNLNFKKTRFRQHLPNEMAHYSSDCWDFETFVNNEWLECIGCADRGSYDLEAHSQVKNITMKRKLETPIIETKFEITLDQKKGGRMYREHLPKINEYLKNLLENDMKAIINMKDDEYITYPLSSSCIDDDFY